MDPGAVLPPVDQPGVGQDLEVMRNGRLGHSQSLWDVAHACLEIRAVGQHRDHAKPGGIGYGLEALRKLDGVRLVELCGDNWFATSRHVFDYID